MDHRELCDSVCECAMEWCGVIDRACGVNGCEILCLCDEWCEETRVVCVES